MCYSVLHLHPLQSTSSHSYRSQSVQIHHETCIHLSPFSLSFLRAQPPRLESVSISTGKRGGCPASISTGRRDAAAGGHPPPRSPISLRFLFDLDPKLPSLSPWRGSWIFFPIWCWFGFLPIWICYSISHSSPLPLVCWTQISFWTCSIGLVWFVGI
jgi:hypothetical protein